MERVKGIIEAIKELEFEHEKKMNDLKSQITKIELTQEEFDLCYWSECFHIELIDKLRNRKASPVSVDYKCCECKKIKTAQVTTKSKLKEFSVGLNKKNGRGSKTCPECVQKSKDKFNPTWYHKSEPIKVDYSKMDYAEYLKTPKWKGIKAKIRKRANNKCEKCGSAKGLHTHHLTYERRGNEKLSDLICLCKNCHEYVHGRKFEVR